MKLTQKRARVKKIKSDSKAFEQRNQDTFEIRLRKRVKENFSLQERNGKAEKKMKNMVGWKIATHNLSSSKKNSSSYSCNI